MSNTRLWTTTQAAELLGVKRQRIDQMYRDGILSGPPRAPRSRILLFASTVENYAQSTRQQRKPKPTDAPSRHDLDRLEHLLESYRVRLDDLERNLAEARGREQVLQTANLALAAAADDLRDSAELESAVSEQLQQALASARAASAALRRADRHRSRAIGQFHLPNLLPPEDRVKG